MKTEPVLWIQAVQSVLRNGFLMAIGLGWVALDQSQLEQVLLFSASVFFVAEMVLGGWLRSLVTPTVKFTQTKQR